MKYFLSLIALIITLSINAKTTGNELKNHSSPYLAMHGNDPVNWMEWGKPALDKAKKENKLLFISIGYFACHWCHVMQRESYADKKVAQKLNKNYISVKVDRELNPVLDKRLIEFVQMTNGTAGWPLNVFLTPEAYPLVGATYVPREQFASILDQLSKKWKTEQATLQAHAKEMSETLVSMLQKQENTISDNKSDAKNKTKTIQQLADSFVTTAMQNADTMQGGFGQRRKFPQIPQLWALLKLNKTNNKPSTKKQADDFIKLTLKQITEKGLHDELGGGFYRYTIDPDWETPHFEKMLYTNAMMPLLFFDAADHYNNDQYRQTALETLYFLQDSMLTKKLNKNAFITSLSAVDDKGEEGGFYLWTQDELRKVLTPEELKLANLYWNMQRANELPAGNLPRVVISLSELAAQLKLEEIQTTQLLKLTKNKLKKHRDKTRKLPRDTKLLAGMNGLVLGAFARGIKYDKSLTPTGSKLSQFLINLWNGKMLRRSVANNKQGTLYDYAAVSWGLLQWAKASGDKQAKKTGYIIAKVAWQRFYKNKKWFENPDSLLPPGVEQSHLQDSSLISAEALLLEASYLSGDSNLISEANTVQKIVSRSLEVDSYSFASLLALQTNKISTHKKAGD